MFYLAHFKIVPPFYKSFHIQPMLFASFLETGEKWSDSSRSKTNEQVHEKSHLSKENIRKFDSEPGLCSFK